MEVITVLLIILYPLLFCRYKNDIVGKLCVDCCLTNPETPLLISNKTFKKDKGIDKDNSIVSDT